MTPERLREIAAQYADECLDEADELNACADAWGAALSKWHAAGLVLRQIHEAIGESPDSDDESLPGVIGKTVADYKAAVERAERERDQANTASENTAHLNADLQRRLAEALRERDEAR